MRRFTALTLVCQFCVSFAHAQVQPTLTITFDKDLNGVGVKGVVTGILQGKPELAPGKVGQAMKAGPTIGQLEFPTEGLLSPLGGTVEMWVSPVDWKPDDGKFHVFFEAKGEGALYLYKYWVGTNLLLLTCNNLQGPYSSTQMPTGDWKPGEWHHIAGTWSSTGVQCYIDGKPAGKFAVAGSSPKSFGQTFTIGDLPWQFPRETSSLVDEVRVYDRALTPQHIAEHAKGNYDYKVTLAPENTKVDYKIDPTGGEADVRVDTCGADVEDARIGGRMAIVSKGGAVPGNAANLKFTGGQTSATLPLASNKPGAYEVVTRVLLDGKQAFDLRSELTIPTAEWLGNKIGLEDKVLPPWTALKVSGGVVSSKDGRKKLSPTATTHNSPLTVSCWGREYEFNQSALPTQIKSAGAAMLSRPIALRLAAGGAGIALEKQSVRRGAASDTRAELSGTATAKLGDVSARFTTHVTTEYDGLMLFDVTCDQPDKLPLDSLSVEVPVKAANAIYRHRYGTSWIPTSGNVPAGEGVVDKTPFIPDVWLGDNDRGLFWFCESDEMWPNAKADNAIEIVRSGNEVALRLNILAAGQKLPANWKLIFGLQATPVKSIPKDWRKWRFQGSGKTRNATVNIVWPVANRKDSLKCFGFPEAADPELFQKNIDEIHAKGEKAVPYLCLTYTTGSTPEWQYYSKIWEMGSTDPSIPEVGWNHTFHMVSPVGKGYADYILWRTKEFLERYGIDGTYHDQTHPYTSNNTISGVGYKRDGQEFSSHPILGYRALYRRNYALVKSLPRDTFTNAHMSGKVTIPILAYEDSYLDGEHFRDMVKESYMDVMTLDSFRCEYMGRQWGLIPVFLPEFDAEHSGLVEPTRGMMALLMLHDVGLWPIWCNEAVVNEAFAALDEFGYVDSDFIPYFDSAPPATTDMKDVYISAYKRADGRVLLIVGNLSKEVRQGDVQINSKRIGLPLNKVISWPDKQPVSVINDRVGLEVPRLGYRMLLVER